MIMHKSRERARQTSRAEKRRRGTAEAAARQEGEKKESSKIVLPRQGFQFVPQVCEGVHFFVMQQQSEQQQQRQQLLFPSQQFVARGLFGHCDRGKVGAFFGQQAIKDAGSGDDRNVIAGASII